MRKTSMSLCVLTVLTSASAMAAESQHWKEVGRHVLGGAGGWDLLTVDASSRRVFITRGDHLMVADADSGKVVGDVPGLKRAHGVVIVPSKKRGFVSSGGDDRVVAFDLESFKVVAEIPTGKNPDAMLFDAASQHVFVFNGHSNNATVIDPSSSTVVATIDVPGKPELAVGDGHGKVFVNLEDKNLVALIDSKSNKVVGTWALGTCEEPTGIALDAAHKRLFSVCANKQMAVLDSSDGHLVTTVAIGDGPDGAAFDEHGANALSSNSDGTLTIVHEDDPTHFHVVANVATPIRSRTIALDDKTHHAILPIAEFGPAPAPTKEEPHPRPSMKPDTFGIVIVGLQ